MSLGPRSSIVFLNESSSVVGGRGHVSTVARPVGVDEMTGFGQQLIRVSSKVVPLGLKEKHIEFQL